VIRCYKLQVLDTTIYYHNSSTTIHYSLLTITKLSDISFLFLTTDHALFIDRLHSRACSGSKIQHLIVRNYLAPIHYILKIMVLTFKNFYIWFILTDTEAKGDLYIDPMIIMFHVKNDLRKGLKSISYDLRTSYIKNSKTNLI
jgi:hypothetical protein